MRAAQQASVAAAILGALVVTGAPAGAQVTDFVSLTDRDQLPTTGASGSVASFAVSAEGDAVAFHSFAGDLLPGVIANVGQTYVRLRRGGKTVLASQSTSGATGDGQSLPMDLSWSGRWLLFRSQAGNLDPLDANPAADVFLRDLESGTTTLVSFGPNGSPSNAAAGYYGSVSGDGRFVAFESWASNAVPNDLNAVRDVFLVDRASGSTMLVSVALGGGSGNGESFATQMSDDGRYVVFSSLASDLVVGDLNGKRDCFLRDTVAGTTTLVSGGLAGAGADGDSNLPEVTNDGRLVVFASLASNLVAGDTNNTIDVFLRDLSSGTTQRVSLGLGGVELNGSSDRGGISADGKRVGFASRATNHGFGDVNGSMLDVFLLDRAAGTLLRASQDSSGVQAERGCYGLRLSAEGRALVFASNSANLGPFKDTNNYTDVFVHDAFASTTQTYCTAKTSSTGCAAAMSGEGLASVSAPAPFRVRARDVNNQRSGLIFFGFAPANQPFQGGVLCVAPPLARTAVQRSEGSPPPAADCSGSFAIDFNERIRSGSTPQVIAGASVYCQAWYRDPADPFHTALSNGLRFQVFP